MLLPNYNTDTLLKQRLESFASIDKDYWSFRGKAVRENTHAFFQYPAMMVPQMQGSLINTIVDVIPSIKSIYDPFAGSGTVLTETMMAGLDFAGQDINPLAILLCRTKAGPFLIDELEIRTKNLLSIVEQDNSFTVDIYFPGIAKWFKPDVAVELSKIRRAIKLEELLWVRRFFWVALAETIRLTSNSRTSTFKLHIRSEEEIQSRDISPVKTFKHIVYRNTNKLSDMKNILMDRNLLRDNLYQGCIDIYLEDSTVMPSLNTNKYDLLITSPPYGDNKTTVPYGQYSYLPLQWIDLKDIDSNLDTSCLTTTSSIDTQSLGGSLINASKSIADLILLSDSLKKTIKYLENEPRDRTMRVAAFCRDLNKCIDPILASLNSSAYLILTVGNRRVGGRSIPIDSIVTEFLQARGVHMIANIHRTIPTKRMAIKNQIADTMSSETILVLRKGE